MGGVNGQGKQMDGADAADLEIPVPAGTIIRRKVRVPKCGLKVIYIYIYTVCILSHMTVINMEVRLYADKTVG